MSLSALLQISVFPIAGPVPIWRTALCWIALTPLLLALLAHDVNNKPLSILNAASLGYCCGILWYLGNCSWIYQTMYLYGGLSKPIALGILLLFSFYLGLYHALFATCLSMVSSSSLGTRGALLVSPFLWVAVELMRSRVTGFPWDLLGDVPVDNLLLTRLAPLTGVMGISFLVAAINAGLIPVLLRREKGQILVPAIALLLAISIQLCTRMPSKLNPDPQRPMQTAVMMQENLNVGVTHITDSLLTTQQELTQFSDASLHPSLFTQPNAALAPPSKSSTPAVVIWPEAPSHLQSNSPLVRSELMTLARTAQAIVIAGSLGVDFDPSSPRGYFLYDSAITFNASGTYIGRYDKIHLVPWGEFIPFKSFFSFARKLTEGAGDMDRGRERTVFRAGGHVFGVFICYESIFGDEVRYLVQNGADVLVNISDDGWYGDTGAPWQHLNMARMRAIENHRWVLRSTNTGISTAIDPRGQIAFQAPRHIRAAFAFPFDFTYGTTFYTRHGDWFAWLCTLVTVAALAFSLMHRGKQPAAMH